MTIIRIPCIVLNVVNSVWIGLNLCSLLFRRVKQRKRRCSKKNKRIRRSDEEKLKGIEEVVGDTEEKRRRKKDEETKGRDPEYKSLQGLTVSLLPSENWLILKMWKKKKKHFKPNVLHPEFKYHKFEWNRFSSALLSSLSLINRYRLLRIIDYR